MLLPHAPLSNRLLGPHTAPTTDEQTTFSSVLAVIGLGVISIVIGALSAVITTMDALESAKHTHLDSIKVRGSIA